MKRFKTTIEIYSTGNTVFLNYWNPEGNDVICELRESRLIHQYFSENGKEEEKEISIGELISLIHERQ